MATLKRIMHENTIFVKSKQSVGLKFHLHTYLVKIPTSIMKITLKKL